MSEMIQTASSPIRTAILAISGMDCPLCIMRVRNGLLSLRGVLLAHVYLVSAVAIIAYDYNQVTVSDLMGSVTEAGLGGRFHYQARVLSVMAETEVFAAAA